MGSAKSRFPRTQIPLRLKPGLLREVDRHAEAKDLSRNAALVDLLWAGIGKQPETE